MRNSDAARQLLAELSQDWEFIRRNAEKNHAITLRISRDGDADEFGYAALGYTIHNLYNAYESYFFRMAKFFENNVDDLTGHKALLERMTLTIEGIRPALIDEALAERIGELLKFRHVFRNLYKSSLVPAKVLMANEAARGSAEAFLPCHESFCRFLRSLIAQLDEE